MHFNRNWAPATGAIDIQLHMNAGNDQVTFSGSAPGAWFDGGDGIDRFIYDAGQRFRHTSVVFNMTSGRLSGHLAQRSNHDQTSHPLRGRSPLERAIFHRRAHHDQGNQRSELAQGLGAWLLHDLWQYRRRRTARGQRRQPARRRRRSGRGATESGGSTPAKQRSDMAANPEDTIRARDLP